MDLIRARSIFVAGLLVGIVSAEASAQSAGDAYYNFLLGRHLESDENYAGALAALERAASVDPRSAEIRAEIAAFQLRQKSVLKPKRQPRRRSPSSRATSKRIEC